MNNRLESPHNGLPERSPICDDELQEALANCAREPIHRPGSIQPEGVLIAVDDASFEIREVSRNFSILFGLEAEQALGQPLARFIQDADLDKPGHLTGLGEWRQAMVTTFTLRLPGGLESRDALVYRSKGRYVLELELEIHSSENLFKALFIPLRDALWQLEAESDLSRYTRAVADQVRQLTGYDRVMIYRFDTNWDGAVIAESIEPGINTYLGNRFPASDIPPQARALYSLNLVRLITDINAVQVPLLGLDGADESLPLDMTYSGLRSFSPVHLEYLRNMGVRATLTISVIQNSRLWGLIACHHLSPKYIPIRARELNEFIGKTVSLKLTELENADKAGLHGRIHGLLDELTNGIRHSGDQAAVIQQHQQRLLDIVHATGGVLCVDGNCQLLGQTPSRDEVSRLVEWLKPLPSANVYHSNHLSAEYPEALTFAEQASGLLVAPLNSEMTDFMMWFRPGMDMTSRWAGRPHKNLVRDSQGIRLCPRESFDAWIDTHRDQASAWTPLEIAAARDLAPAVIEVLRQHALESSEAHYRLLAENSNDMIVRLSPEGVCTFVSPACQDFLGHPTEAIVGLPLADFLQPGDRQAWHAQLTELTQPGASASLLLRFPHASGKVVWAESVIKRMQNAKGDQDFFLNARDVTQRQTYQLSIEELHRRNALILDSAGEGVISLDLEGLVVYANEQAGKLLGRTPAEMLGRSCQETIRMLDNLGQVFAREECPLFLAMRQNQVRQDKHGAMEHRDGHRVWVEYLSTPLLEEGVVTGCVVVFRAGTPQADGTTQTILDQAMEAVMVTDATGHITSINRSFTDITGYGPDEALGATPKLLKSGIHTQSFYDALWDTLGREGKWSGEIWNRRKNGEIYPQTGRISVVLDQQGQVRNYVAVFTDISQAKQAEEQLSHLANHDSLTDLPNRTFFINRLKAAIARARKTGTRLAVVYLDLDLFKIINETMGHPTGDIYLQAIAARLKEVTRKQDLLARWGGDEFTLAFDTQENHTGIVEMIQRLQSAISAPLHLQGHDLSPTASIGISLYPDDGDVPNDLIKAADTAMYRVKETGRNGFQFHTRKLSEQVRKKFDMTADLRRALRDDEFVLHYQPQVAAESLELVGVEALIRWQHPVRGFLSPVEFVPMAEELGLIQDLGNWVLNHACRQMRQWLDADIPIPRVAVNVAPPQLDMELVDYLALLLKRYRLAPAHLEVEIVEGALERDDSTRKILANIRRLGIPLSVDDFGTGYSSLAHIKHFPISCFKIDKSFVDGVPENAQDVAIIRTISALGSSLEVDVIAEGVETAQQYEMLKGIGINALQGYYFGKPEPAEAIALRSLLVAEKGAWLPAGPGHAPPLADGH